jgi:hypothetical protein
MIPACPASFPLQRPSSAGLDADELRRRRARDRASLRRGCLLLLDALNTTGLGVSEADRNQLSDALFFTRESDVGPGPA